MKLESYLFKKEEIILDLNNQEAENQRLVGETFAAFQSVGFVCCSNWFIHVR